MNGDMRKKKRFVNQLFTRSFSARDEVAFALRAQAISVGGRLQSIMPLPLHGRLFVFSTSVSKPAPAGKTKSPGSKSQGHDCWCAGCAQDSA